MVQRLRINEFVSSCMTRRRGEEAYQLLAPYMRSGPIEVEFDGANVVSSSFLDELVRNLNQADQTEAVTFVTDDDQILDKLARITGTRGAVIYVRSEGAERHRVAPQTGVEYTTEFVSDKIFAD